MSRCLDYCLDVVTLSTVVIPIFNNFSSAVFSETHDYANGAPPYSQVNYRHCTWEIIL